MSPARDDAFDARALAARGGTLERTYTPANLPRIAALDTGAQSRLDLEARFELLDGRVAVRGRLHGRIDLRCQRCLGWVGVRIDESLHLVVVESESAMPEEPATEDAVVADATRLDIGWLVEEEALLALPLVPMHPLDSGHCDMRAPESAGRSNEAGVVKRQRPFANLRDLLQKS